MFRRTAQIVYGLTRGVGKISLTTFAIASRMLDMNALKSWPAKLVLGSTVMASGAGGWWWMQKRPDSTPDATSASVNPADELRTPAQPIGLKSDDEGGSSFGATGNSAPAGVTRANLERSTTGRGVSARTVSWNQESSDGSNDSPPNDPTAGGSFRTNHSRQSTFSGRVGGTVDVAENGNINSEGDGGDSVQTLGGNASGVGDNGPIDPNEAASAATVSAATVSAATASVGDEAEPPQDSTPPRLFTGYSKLTNANQIGDTDDQGEAAPPQRQNGFASQGSGGKTSRVSPASGTRSSGPQSRGVGTSLSDSTADETTPASPTSNARSSNRDVRNSSANTQIRGNDQMSSRAQTAPIPGDRKLEGAQNPHVTIEKLAPDEVQVGKPAIFEIYVRNDGKVPAIDVTVSDHIPQGTRLIEASPEFSDNGGELIWKLGRLDPGKETKITLQVMPEIEGEIGSVAQVEFRAQASVRTISTKPQLIVEHKAPSRILIGEKLTFAITISNPGTGAATGVVLQEEIPEGLSHPAGAELEYEVGTLRPGETRNLNLELRAEKPGVIENIIRLAGDGDLVAEHRLSLEVIAPELQVGVKGPAKRYLDRQVTFEVSVANPGTASAENVDLVAHMPKGLEFVSTDNKGQYDPRTHAVYWSLTELLPGDSGSVHLIAMPVEPGDQRLRIEGTGDMGLEATQEHIMVVEHATELAFSVSDTADPIEEGAETVYEIRITNNGAKPITNVRMTAAASPELEILKGDGPTRVTVQQSNIGADPIAKLAPKQEVIYRLQARGRQAGDHLLRVQIVSDETPAPVTKEEGTRVYADQ